MEKESNKKKIYNTTDIERELLHILLSNKISLQRNFSLLRRDWFTSNSRVFVVDCILDNYERTRSLISQQGLKYELEKRYDIHTHKERISDYLSEITCIYDYPLTQNEELLVGKLKEADLASEIAEVTESIFEKLNNGDISEALNELKRKTVELKPVESQISTRALHGDAKKEWLHEIINRVKHPELYAGIPIGFEKFDKYTGGLFKAELTIVFGLSGKGKSTFLKNIGTNIRRSGRNVLHVTNEENQFQVETKYQTMEFAKEHFENHIKYYKFKNGKINEEELQRWEQFNDKIVLGKETDIYTLELPQGVDASYIEREFINLKLKGVNIDAIIIDYLDLMAPIRKAFNENDEQAKITNDCKQLAINCNVPVLSCTQAATSAEKQETKDTPYLTAADIYGTKRKAHSANTLIGIINKTATVNMGDVKTESEKRLHQLVFCVPKNRDGASFIFRQELVADIGLIRNTQEEKDEEVKKTEKYGKDIMSESIDMEKENKVKKIKLQTSTQKKKEAVEEQKEVINEIQNLIKNNSAVKIEPFVFNAMSKQ